MLKKELILLRHTEYCCCICQAPEADSLMVRQYGVRLLHTPYRIGSLYNVIIINREGLQAVREDGYISETAGMISTYND